MARQTKIGLFGQLTPTGIDQTAGAKLRALAGVTGQIGQVAFQVGAKQREKQGRIEGAKVKRDDKGNVIPLELESDSTIFGEAFNKSAILSHQMQVQIDTKEQLDLIQNEFKDDPEGFKVGVRGLKKGTLKGMPEELSIIVSRDIDASASNRLSQVNKAFFAKEEARKLGVFNSYIETITDDMTNAARAGDDEYLENLIIENKAKLDVSVEQGLISPSKAEAVIESLAERVIQQKTLKQIDDIVFSEDLSLEEQVIKGSEFLEQLTSSPPSDLSAEQNESLRNVINAKVNGLKTNLAKERAKVSIDTQRDISNLEILIKTGIGDPEKLALAVEDFFNDELITRAHRTSLLIALNNKFKNSFKKDKDFTDVAKKLIGDSPEIVISQKIANDYYDEIYETQFEGLDADSITAHQAEFIEKIRVVPASIKNQISNNILSNNPELIRQTASLIDRIDEISGLPELALSKNDKAFINIVNTLTNLEPEQAVEIARRATEPNDKARIEARKSQIKEEKWESGGFTSSGYKGKVVEFSAFEGFFGGSLLNTINVDRMVMEFKDQVESSFIAGDSKEKAFERAEQDLTKQWKESQFGFMKHIPEDYYGTNDNNYMKAQLLKELKAGTIGLEFDKDKIFLISDDQTDREASSGSPSYEIILIDDSGSIVRPVLTDPEGNPSSRWRPDRELEIKKQIELSEKKALGIRGAKTVTLDKLVLGRRGTN